MQTHLFLSLPFIAAMCYGFGYIFLEKMVGVHINTASFLVVSVVATLVSIIPLLVMGEKIDFSGVFNQWPVLLMVMLAASIPALGWLLTLFAIKNTSALYTAMAESSYPLFTLAFGYLFFGIKHLNLVTFIGGLMILSGAAIMIYGQSTMQDDGL